MSLPNTSAKCITLIAATTKQHQISYDGLYLQTTIPITKYKIIIIIDYDKYLHTHFSIGAAPSCLKKNLYL